MRFRRLELVRYGGHADRVFDFGEHGLHCRVGRIPCGDGTSLLCHGGHVLRSKPAVDADADRHDRRLASA